MMKSINKILTATAVVLNSAMLTAQQIDLKTPAQNLANQIKGIFPYVAVAIFVVVILTNLGHFVKENGDWKKGLTNIVLYAVIIGVVVGLVAYVGNISLN